MARGEGAQAAADKAKHAKHLATRAGKYAKPANKGESSQEASKKAKDAARAAIPNVREGRVPIIPPTPYVGHYGQQPPPTPKPGKGGKGNKGKGNDEDKKSTAREIYPVAQVQIPLGSGQVLTPNLQEAYIKEVTRLTLNLLSSAENLLFAYNFTGINRIASYMLERDDANVRETSVVSSIIRSRSGVELTELEVRDKLNFVLNSVAAKIGDLATTEDKLKSFGQKQGNLEFIEGVSRISGGLSYYDLKLDLPDIQGFGYDVLYTVKLFEIKENNGSYSGA
jgi:hypothetical protein